MSELPKKYDSHDDSTSNKVSSSKACNTKDTERQRKHPRSDEESSRHILLNDQQTKDINQQNQHSTPKPEEKDANAFIPIRYIPDLKNKHQRDQFDAIKKGMKFTGVIDGSFPGGYFITVGVGNCPTLSGVAMFNSDQPAQIDQRDVKENVPTIPTNIGLTCENQNETNKYPQHTGNPDQCIDIDMDKIPLGLKVPDELTSKYSDSEMLYSHEVQIPYKPVVLKPVNPTGVPMAINQTNSLDKGKYISEEYYSAPTGCGIMIDPFLRRNFSSSALSITPPSDQVATSSFLGKTPTVEQTCESVWHLNQNTKITAAEQFARVSQLGINSSSLNQNTSQHVLSKNIETRTFLQHQLESQNQQSDHAQPNSSSHTSKKSKHMQDNN